LQKLPRKREDVAALSQAEVVPEMFCHVHAERGCALTPVWGEVPQFISDPSDRLVSQPCKKIRKGNPPHNVNVRLFHTVGIYWL